MTLTISRAQFRFDIPDDDFFTTARTAWEPPVRGSIVALDAADALSSLLTRCAAATAGRPDLWGASVDELLRARTVI